MHNLDPNDMDALFRDGADKHEFTYNPDAWALMEEKLDNKDKRAFIYWLLLGALAILLSIGTFSYFNSSAKNALTSNNDDVEFTGNNNIQNIEENISNDRNEAIKVDNKDQLLQSKEVSTTVETNIVSETQNKYIKTVSKVRSHNIVAHNRFQKGNTGNLAINEIVSILTAETQNPLKPVFSNTVIEEGKDLINISFIDGLDLKPFDQEKEAIDFGDLEITIDPIVIPLNIPTRRFAFTAFANAEFSSVGFLGSTQRAGWKVGVKTGYQFAKKWQIDLGVAISRKRFGSVGSEYNKADGWIDDIQPTWMDAKSTVIEIPLEASYYINGYKNDGFFVNAGISSYILNSEWYGFKYDESDLLVNPDLLEEIFPEEINMNHHISGVGKLSFGYQKILSPKMALEVSPYLQIPLTGIGEGKVDLYTTGIQFAVRFN